MRIQKVMLTKLKTTVRYILDYLFCWDALLALALCYLVIHLLPSSVLASLVKEFAGAGISVASITFSVCLAALAITISGADDNFVSFLEEDRVYSGMLGRFRYSLIVTFINLLTTLILFAWATIANATCEEISLKSLLLAAYVGLFAYSLFVVMNSTMEMFYYASRRAKYLHGRRETGRLDDEP